MGSASQNNHEYVYLLVNEQNDAFKIGKAVNVQNRMSALPESFDIEKSCCLVCEPGDAIVIEKILHRMFRHHNVEMPTGEGHTEWFCISCLDEVKDFIDREKLRLGYIDIEPILIKVSEVTLRKPKTNEEIDTGNIAMVDALEKVLQNAIVCGNTVGITNFYEHQWLVIDEIISDKINSLLFDSDTTFVWRSKDGSVSLISRIVKYDNKVIYIELYDFDADRTWRPEIYNLPSVVKYRRIISMMPKLKNEQYYKDKYMEENTSTPHPLLDFLKNVKQISRSTFLPVTPESSLFSIS